ncbi:Lipase 1 [Papilio xuthus]|uniref:Lipase n=1 Tax=Papilio xuthus TaxID=66420 RepID=A0A194QC53_PAPXU|nr:Lipase 1 [Papilio xuthus]
MSPVTNTSLILYLSLVLFKNVLGDIEAGVRKPLKFNLNYPSEPLINFTELATRHGYVSEQHTVITEDGYILTMFRITKGRNCRRPIKRPPVLLMHGLLMSSDCFLDSGPNAGLAYLISDLCYDLWLPNIRGNYYSRRHIKLDPDVDQDFWDFSNLEFGYYDIPASIDYILHHTKSKKLNYIGFSQGGGSFLVMNSKRPEYMEKTGVAILLEPGTRHTYTRSRLFRLLCETYLLYYPLLTDIGEYEALPLGGIVQKLTAFLCKDSIAASSGCRLALGLIDGPHPGSVETETIKMLFNHFPAGTSLKNIVWYGQAVNVDTFQNFDYGASKNLQVYGSVQPPAFNLSLVEVPIVIIHGRNDFFASPADVEWMASKLPNLLEQFYVEEPLWNHFDVTYSRLTSKYILPKISEYLKKYSN